jgi:hypothetical protein
MPYEDIRTISTPGSISHLSTVDRLPPFLVQSQLAGTHFTNDNHEL